MNAFIFDMDGVIIDSEPIHTRTKIQTFHRFGLKLTKEECHPYMGRSTREMFQYFIDRYDPSISVTEMVAYKHEIYLKTLREDDEIKPIAGIKKLLQSLEDRGIPMALASSSGKKNIQTVLQKFGFARYFQSILSGAELPKSKPHPAVYLLSAERLGVLPENCVVLEDATAGVEAAKAAEMYCIGYQNPNSGQQDLSKADTIVHFLHEINVENLFGVKGAGRG